MWEPMNLNMLDYSLLSRPLQGGTVNAGPHVQYYQW